MLRGCIWNAGVNKKPQVTMSLGDKRETLGKLWDSQTGRLGMKRDWGHCRVMSLLKFLFRCSLPKAMSISRSEIFRKKAETENSNLLSVKVLESVCLGHLLQWCLKSDFGNKISEILFLKSDFLNLIYEIWISEIWFLKSDFWIIVKSNEQCMYI